RRAGPRARRAGEPPAGARRRRSRGHDDRDHRCGRGGRDLAGRGRPFGAAPRDLPQSRRDARLRTAFAAIGELPSAPVLLSPTGYTSRLATESALAWMKSRRGSTRSPIRVEKVSSAESAWLTLTCSNERISGSSVVSHNWSG